MKKSIKQTVLRTALLFVCLIAFYFIAMSAVYFIPTESIAQGFLEGAEIIYGEGEYNEPFFGIPSGRLDGTTDIIMMKETQQTDRPDMNPFQAAMYINGYSRFWHGYQIFLRPALAVMGYRQIRYFNTFVFFILLCLSFASVKKHISTLTAVCYVITLMMTFTFLAPVCMQFMPGYTVTFLSIIVMLKYKDNFRAVYLLFFAAGSVMNFFDLLTFPLLTLGLPLAVLYFAREKSMAAPAAKKFVELILCSFMWGLGYALTWITKWALGSLVTGINVFTNVAWEAKYRMVGNENWPLDRVAAYKANILALATVENIAIALIVLAALVLLVILSRKSYKYILKSSPVLLLALYPYAWYYVFGNHSQFHSFFTYRSQMITVFVGFALLAGAVDMERVKAALSKLFKRKKTAAPSAAESE